MCSCVGDCRCIVVCWADVGRVYCCCCSRRAFTGFLESVCVLFVLLYHIVQGTSDIFHEQGSWMFYFYPMPQVHIHEYLAYTRDVARCGVCSNVLSKSFLLLPCAVCALIRLPLHTSALCFFVLCSRKRRLPNQHLCRSSAAEV